MKNSVKAALLSFLIFPGAGHFALRRYRRGLVFLLPALASIYVLLQDAIAQANALAGQLLDGNAPQAVAASPYLQLATWVFMICWIAGVADALRLGRQQDREPGQ